MESIDYPGKLIANRYAVSHELGQGGMGVVYAADDLHLSRRVAVKFMNGLSDQSIARFKREYKLLAKVDCPNIVQIFERGQTDDGIPFIVMECIKGRTLEQALSDPSDTPEIEEIITIAAQVCTALSHLHTLGLVHRDLNPSNIMLTKDDSTIEAKLMDFGAVHETDIALTATNELLGSPNYMSPEHLTPKLLDGRSDIFSLGCVLYRCVAGKPPFEADSALQTLLKIQTGTKEILNSSVPLFLRNIIDRCTRPNPSDRFQSAEDLHKALTERKCDQPASAPSPRAISIKPVLIALISIALVGSATAIFVRTTSSANDISRTKEELALLSSKNNWKQFDELVSKKITTINQNPFPETWESFDKAAQHFQLEGNHEKAITYNALAIKNCNKINHKALLELDGIDKRLCRDTADRQSDQASYQWLWNNANRREILHDSSAMLRLATLKAKLSQRLNLNPAIVARNFAAALQLHRQFYDEHHLNELGVFDVGLDYARFLVAHKDPARKEVIENIKNFALDRLKNNSSYTNWIYIVDVLNLVLEEASSADAVKLLAEFEPYPPKNQKDRVSFCCEMYRISLRTGKARKTFIDNAYKQLTSSTEVPTKCDVLLLMAHAHPKRKMELIQEADRIARENSIEPHCRSSIHANLAQAYAERDQYKTAVRYLDQAIQEYVAGKELRSRTISLTTWENQLHGLQKTRQLWYEKAKSLVR